ncbi:carbohydrate esterase family 3 protein [Trichoderma virens Gv29-8]|uniref:Carbohydrate esterase family 3 protein n=1 Tax=Hypocrea virens (strain Gv29-8 / FGSC 10586) TaxID=413071 RepID=G9MV29_HYPVG|nr:carbohydrate esterase family 3 protein [Trichoderma virens Gv29-8]EHK21684.1 carbohydrate esterase family 3 protein [Trichoderma virens Gv29-8]
MLIFCLLIVHSNNTPYRTIRVMPLGGSITYGVGSSDKNGYRQYLQDMLTANGHHVTMVGSRSSGSMRNNNHEGWRGFRIDQIESKARNSVPKLMPDLVMINAGSNDCIQNFDIEHIGKRMDNMLEFVWSASPDSTIILSTLILNLDTEVESRIKWVNNQFQDIILQKQSEGKRIAFVDMHSQGGPKNNDILSDGTHPNDQGYYKMARIWYGGVLDVMSKGFLP